MNRGISQSGLSLYRRCPFAYKLHYVDLAEPMFFSQDVLDVGRYVHDAIDEYYRHYYVSEGTVDDILIKSYGALKEQWDLTLPAEQLRKAYDCLLHHAEWEHKNITNGIGTKPFTEVEINGEGLYGFIDYVDLQNHKVIDWKTNRYATLSYEYRMQAHVYRKLFESKFGEKLTHFYFFFLYPNQWRCVKFNDKKQEEVGKEVESLLNDILECNFPKQPRTDKGCRTCNYRFYCKILGGNEEDVVQEED